jgi:hypothetical protein
MVEKDGMDQLDIVRETKCYMESRRTGMPRIDLKKKEKEG